MRRGWREREKERKMPKVKRERMISACLAPIICIRRPLALVCFGCFTVEHLPARSCSCFLFLFLSFPLLTAFSSFLEIFVVGCAGSIVCLFAHTFTWRGSFAFLAVSFKIQSSPSTAVDDERAEIPIRTVCTSSAQR